jgi:hypothetical protein
MKPKEINNIEFSQFSIVEQNNNICKGTKLKPIKFWKDENGLPLIFSVKRRESDNLKLWEREFNCKIFLSKKENIIIKTLKNIQKYIKNILKKLKNNGKNRKNPGKK